MVISKIRQNKSNLKRFALPFMTWAVSVPGTHLVLQSFGLADQPYSNIIINIIFMLTTLGCIRALGLSPGDVGFKFNREKLPRHAGLCLIILSLYWLYYLFVVRISGLRTFNSSTVWGLLNFALVAFVEEIYFRGLIFHIVDGKASGRIAVLITGLVFGLAHYHQGLGMLPKFFTGWLFGSIRYATGMIFPLIPVHFTLNTVWLLFEGNWINTSLITNLLPLVELLVAVFIVALFKNTRKLEELGTPSIQGHLEEVPL